VSSAVKPRRGGHLPPSPRPANLPAVAVGPAPEPIPTAGQVELLGLGVLSTVFELVSPAERRRLLAFLTDRYGEEQS
jgi:hypothetical protein